MKNALCSIGVAVILTLSNVCGAAAVPLIGILNAKNDSFQNLLSSSMEQRAHELNVDTFMVSAEDDSQLQMRQLKSLIEGKVDAIIVAIVDAGLADEMINLTSEAKIPLVFVNRLPSRTDWPSTTAFVGSDELQSGTFLMEELARRANYKGNVAILVGDPTKTAAQLRTQDVEQVVAKYPNMKIVKKESANWERSQAATLVSQWLDKNLDFSIIAANNDEMAIGAIRALEKADKPLDRYLVGGIDGTPDGLQAMKDGKMAASVLQDAKGQGELSIDIAMDFIKHAPVKSMNWVPFKPITSENLYQFR